MRAFLRSSLAPIVFLVVLIGLLVLIPDPIDPNYNMHILVWGVLMLLYLGFAFPWAWYRFPEIRFGPWKKKP